MTYKSFPISSEIYSTDMGDCVAKLKVEDQCVIVELTKPLITTAEDWGLFAATVTQSIAELRPEDMP